MKVCIVIYKKYIFGLLHHSWHRDSKALGISYTLISFVVNEVTFGKPLGNPRRGAACQVSQLCD